MTRRALTAVLMVVATTAGAQSARLEYSRPPAGITRVVVEAGVGEVEVIGGAESAIAAQVQVKSKGLHFWGHHRDEASVADTEIEATVEQGTLTLKIGHGHGDERSFGEDWTVRLPRDLAVKVELGVGEVKVLDVASDIVVDLGVGDVRVEGDDAVFGDIRASSGVGDTSLRTPSGHEDGDGLISHSLRSRGSGKATVRISTGVGDTEIRLH